MSDKPRNEWQFYLGKKIEVNLIICPTKRDKNGLALSSRNKLLSKKNKKKSSIIYESLIYLKKYFQNKPVPLIINEVKTKINSFQDFQIEYLEIVNNKSLQLESNYDKNKVYRAFICVSVKGVRLIDNILLN